MIDLRNQSLGGVYKLYAVAGDTCYDVRTCLHKNRQVLYRMMPVPKPPQAPPAAQQAAPTPQGGFTPYNQAPPAVQTQSTVSHIPDIGDEQYSHPGWSWGGFFWGIPFLIAIRKYRYLLLLLAPILMIFGVVTLWGIMAVVGQVNGSSDTTMAFALIVPIAIALAALFFAGLPLYFGFKGRMLAATSKTFSNKEQYVGFMKAFDHGAMVAFFVMIASWVVLIVFGVLFGVLVGIAEMDTSAAALNAIDHMQGYFK